MRKLLPFLFLAIFCYAGWYYWQVFTDEPLQEKLLLHTNDELERIVITAFGETPFQLVRTEQADVWTVKQGITEIHDQTARVEQLLEVLVALRTDSVAPRFSDNGLATLELAGAGYTEQIELAFAEVGLTLARLKTTGDVFALNEAAASKLPGLLRLAAYQENRLLRIAPPSVDSILAYYHDSLLWRIDSGEMTRLVDPLIAPASSPSAAYFDEIMDQEKYYATLALYVAGIPHRITVYQDTLWPQPLVLIGEDFPRQYWPADSLLAF